MIRRGVEFRQMGLLEHEVSTIALNSGHRLMPRHPYFGHEWWAHEFVPCITSQCWEGCLEWASVTFPFPYCTERAARTEAKWQLDQPRNKCRLGAATVAKEVIPEW